MWLALSLFFALWTSISIVIVKRLTKDVSSLHILLANNLFILPFMFVIILSLGGIPKVSPTMPLFPSFFGSILLILLVSPFVLAKKQQAITEIRRNFRWFLLLAPFSALAQGAAYSAFSLVNVGYVTAIFKLSTLFTILWGWLIFNEERIKERLLGAIVMILGTILLIY